MTHSSETISEVYAAAESTPAPAGTTARRLLDSDWIGDLYAAVNKPDNELKLVLELSAPATVETHDLAESEALSVLVEGGSDGVERIEVMLIDQNYRDTFFVLVADLVSLVTKTESEEAGARVLVRHLGRWLHFLKRKGINRLSRSRIIGLYGELTVLLDVLAGPVGIDAALRAWTGPEGSFQDFQFPGVAIEVKALASTQPQRLSISSERQLDDRGLGALLLAHLSIEVRQGSGRTLPQLVAEIDAVLEGRPACQEIFDQRLFEAGYHRVQAILYEDLGFTDRTIHLYRVGPSFPRILETDLPLGVGGVDYKVDATACAPFEVHEDVLIDWLSEPPDPLDGAVADEGELVEHKQTAWKPMRGGDTPTETINYAVVKTIAAFQNSYGGALVIGVEDRTMVVTGIEEDLVFLGIDRDSYEQRLIGLFRKYLGDKSLAGVRIRFEARDGKTVCVIQTRASRSPVFGSDPRKPDKGPTFWVREGNTTRPLHGEAMANYLFEHFR